ncbi:hypothetical protein QE152_g15666 [Popillia japonica]|uniref:Uncharacterized protein n=1 Tax=Popillia japonica TaxID=7064 RepID=A0AAW1L880_POPJA
MQNVVSPKEIRPVCKAKPRKITQQNKEIRPVCKAKPRKITQQNRKRRHTAILTDTPEKEELETQEKLRKQKLDKKGKKKVKRQVFEKNDKENEV